LEGEPELDPQHDRLLLVLRQRGQGRLVGFQRLGADRLLQGRGTGPLERLRQRPQHRSGLGALDRRAQLIQQDLAQVGQEGPLAPRLEVLHGAERPHERRLDQIVGVREAPGPRGDPAMRPAPEQRQVAHHQPLSGVLVAVSHPREQRGGALELGVGRHRRPYGCHHAPFLAPMSTLSSLERSVPPRLRVDLHEGTR
jgi:hypothetical protein